MPVPTIASALLLAATTLHPHVPRVIGIKLTEGEATLSYFTVPFNAEHLKNVKPGFSWHAGFARLSTPRELKAGGRTIPAGEYKLDFVKGEGDAWQAEFAPQRLAQGKRALAVAKREKDEPKQKRIETELAAMRKEGKGEIVVPFTEFRQELLAVGSKAPDAEHLRFRVECDGYVARSMQDNTPASGVEFAVFADFGPLHGALRLEEVFAGEKKAEEKPGEQPKKGG